VLTAFPSENEALKNVFLKKNVLKNETKWSTINAKIIVIIKKSNHFILTEAAIPIVIARKYIDNSRGDLTGFLNRTIERAPTIPRDKAILPDITLVITNVINGKSIKVAVWA
tara:strand:- start:622 stop:957 length:336 start_codon:yes stop_codon:yes gene_type:complete